MRIVAGIAALAVAFVALLYVVGSGWLGEPWGAGEPTNVRRPLLQDAEGRERQSRAFDAMQVSNAKRILFGDLHVHTTYSVDAFFMAMPLAGGNGAHPVSDACDFARFCSALDFWSINDHAISVTPARWRETIAQVRQCDAVATATGEPDTIPFLGWEWTQVGANAPNHYGHKNVILKHLDEARIPARPIAAGAGGAGANPGSFLARVVLGWQALPRVGQGGGDLMRFLQDTATPACPSGVPVRELSTDCREFAATPGELFAKLDDWGVDSMVIPHGTTWGMYTPPGSSWDKQLEAGVHDPRRQFLVEMFSGHGNSEEYRAWAEVVLHEDGTRSCPEPTSDYLPSCWQAGEIIRDRCLSVGESDAECESRGVSARQHWVDADNAGHRLTVPGAKVEEWLDAGQCTDCFQPSFSFRPKSSVQYMLSLANREAAPGFQRFRFGFIASSDNHSSRPGTGYKEFGRTTNTEARFANIRTRLFPDDVTPTPRSQPLSGSVSGLAPFRLWQFERGASFMLNGGLVAVHAREKSRSGIWEALVRKEVYATSGPRILLWFDLVSGSLEMPMGSDVSMIESPEFRVRAAGSFEQAPGCPAAVAEVLGDERVRELCGGECYQPSGLRRLISRIEVVRIRPRVSADEVVDVLIEDPWKVLPCPPNPEGCSVTFRDDEFPRSRRDAVYYVRAVEVPSMAVGARPLVCERDAVGRCARVVSHCASRPDDDDCLAETEERAWSSPIFIDYGT
ncbi:MAG: DUF3604 domain-containing protein [Gammaproteobacteria bacterium]|nr:DUF3604 domain-containing protein [Gammaproteobacteria bacterium]